MTVTKILLGSLSSHDLIYSTGGSKKYAYNLTTEAVIQESDWSCCL